MRGQRIWLAVAAIFALLPSCLERIPSADLWWLLAQGRWICQQHALPTQDIFSFTAAGQTWHNDQWLCAILFYGLGSFGGLTALHVFKAILLCLTFALLLDTAYCQLSSQDPIAVWRLALLPLVGLTCLWLSHKEFYFDVRAYLFTYLFSALWWRWLILSKKELSPLPFLITAWLWANLHAGVQIGLGILVLAGLARYPYLKPRWIAAICLVTLINPSGWGLHLHVVRLLGSQWGRFLNEWTPIWTDSKLYGAYPLFMALTIALAARLWRRRQRPGWEALCLLVVGLLSLTGWRHIPLFCWLSIPLWCAQIPSSTRKIAREGWIAVLLMLLLAARACYWLPRYSAAQLSFVNLFFPRWAVKFIALNELGPRLFHPYGWGGYLMWQLYPGDQVCIDGRAAQVYPLNVYLDYLRASRSTAGLLKYLEQYQVDTVLLSATPGQEAGRDLLDNQADWPLIYEDDLCCIYQRRSKMKAAYQPADSPRSLLEEARNHLDNADLYVVRALQLDPEYPQAYFLRGVLRLQKGLPDGVADLQKALQLDPTLPNAHLNLGVYFAKTDPQRSERELRDELKVNPSNDQARALLHLK